MPPRRDNSRYRQVTPDQIRAELERHFAEPGAESETYRIRLEMERRLSISYKQWEGYDERYATNYFASQVRTQLDNLAANGQLVRRGERTETRWYTPDGAKAADAAEQARQERNAAARERTQRLHVRLRNLGLHPTGTVTPQLSPDDWQRLVALAERGWTSDKIRGAE